MSEKLRQDLEAGRRTKELLEDEALIAAFETVEQRFIQRWKDSAPEDDKMREQSWFALHGLEAVKRELKIVLDNGNFAASVLEKMKE